MKAPPPVATIFPPFRKRRKSGRACPSIAARPASTPASVLTYIVARKAGTKPLATSSTVTASPYLVP